MEIEFNAKVLAIFKGEKTPLFCIFDTGGVQIPKTDIEIATAWENGAKITISKHNDARSLNANAYCWVLLDKIAKKIGSTKVEIYRQIIKDVGVFEVLPIKNEALDKFVTRWESKGLGWICQIVRNSKIPNYTNVVAYYGTSTYDTAEMSRFLDEVINVAKQNGINTMTPKQIQELKELWKDYELHSKQGKE